MLVRRLAERGRTRLIANIAESRRDFAAGLCQPMTAAELVREAQSQAAVPHSGSEVVFDDPIVAEVRKARDDYARSFNYDLDAICEDLQKRQLLSDRHPVSALPKRPSSRIDSEAPTLPSADEKPDTDTLSD